MDSSKSQKKGRARRACLCCRARKIRCNVMEENPCTNCRLDSVSCVVSRKRRNRKIFATTPPRNEPSQKFNDAAITRVPHGRDSSSLTQATESSNQTFASVTDFITHFPTFIQAPSTRLNLVDLEFLKGKGALCLPTFPTQCALIESYIEHAYHYMPVVDLRTLLATIHNDDQISLLLYQAILFAGAAFVDCDSLPEEDTEFKDRRSARSLLAHRVTLLYDLDYETDELLLVQACLLMSTSSDIPSNRKDCWYWSSLAITHAYSLGLDRDFRSQDLPCSKRNLRKRLWWTCLMRDRLLALGFQRPTRIKSSDFSTFDLSADDFENIVLQGSHYLVGPQCPTLREANRQHVLAEICKHRAKLGRIIESVLELQAAYSKASDSYDYQKLHDKLAERFSEAERSLDAWKEALPESCRLDSSLTINTKSLNVLRSHMHLLYHTVVYSLHRPRFLPTSPTMISAVPHSTSNVSRAKTLAATTQISQIATQLKEARLDRYLPISGLTVIFPAVVMGLLQLKWKNQSLQEVTTRLLACTTVIKTMQRTYVAADAAVAYLSTAIQKFALNSPSQMMLSPSMTIASAHTAEENAQVSSLSIETPDAIGWEDSYEKDSSQDGENIPEDFGTLALPYLTEDANDVEDMLALQWHLGDDGADGYGLSWPPSSEWNEEPSFLDVLLDPAAAS